MAESFLYDVQQHKHATSFIISFMSRNANILL
jgi:hypothetical protein